MVYSFFDPDLAGDSLGSYVILDHVRAGRASPACRTSISATGFRAAPRWTTRPATSRSQIFAEGRWTTLDSADTGALVRRRGDRPAISEQVAAIELPSTR